MARNKRRLRNGRRKNDMQEAFAICLNQKRHDARGNRLSGYDFDEILKMGSEEREKLRAVGWLGKKSNRRGV